MTIVIVLSHGMNYYLLFLDLTGKGGGDVIITTFINVISGASTPLVVAGKVRDKWIR